MKNKKYLLLLLLVLGMVACADKKTTEPNPTPNPTPEVTPQTFYRGAGTLTAEGKLILVTKLVISRAGQDMSNATFSYDNRGRLTSTKISNPRRFQEWSYRYEGDKAFLKLAIDEIGETTEYVDLEITYDAKGNIKLLRGDDLPNMVYDKLGRLTRLDLTYLAYDDGNLSSVDDTQSGFYATISYTDKESLLPAFLHPVFLSGGEALEPITQLMYMAIYGHPKLFTHFPKETSEFQRRENTNNPRAAIGKLDYEYLRWYQPGLPLEVAVKNLIDPNASYNISFRYKEVSLP